ncbi:MAG: hypothetical protein PHH69_01285 [Candidatus Omnitrophica bacterium]|nr:hypothetical protein [Candidatus Omnitrophota bacterium]MDD5610161.1 hypothetical protein [Candidatus Omnitrophota bacterium]
MSDTLVFKGAWQINKEQQITYTYGRTVLKTKIREKSLLVFKGTWQVNSSHKLVYLFEHSRESRFAFRVQLESPNVRPQDASIKYRLGIGVRKDRLKKVILLHGEWKFNRHLGLVFQMSGNRTGISELNFGAVLRLSRENEIIFKLTNEAGEPVGINVIFTHRFLKKMDAEAFLKIEKLKKGSGILAGARIPF